MQCHLAQPFTSRVRWLFCVDEPNFGISNQFDIFFFLWQFAHRVQRCEHFAHDLSNSTHAPLKEKHNNSARNFYDKMAETNEYVIETLLEEKLLDLWPDYPCLYDIRSPTFEDRGKREDAIMDITIKLNKSGR